MKTYDEIDLGKNRALQGNREPIARRRYHRTDLSAGLDGHDDLAACVTTEIAAKIPDQLAKDLILFEMIEEKRDALAYSPRS